LQQAAGAVAPIRKHLLAPFQAFDDRGRSTSSLAAARAIAPVPETAADLIGTAAHGLCLCTDHIGEGVPHAFLIGTDAKSLMQEGEPPFDAATSAFEAPAGSTVAVPGHVWAQPLRILLAVLGLRLTLWRRSWNPARGRLRAK